MFIFLSLIFFFIYCFFMTWSNPFIMCLELIFISLFISILSFFFFSKWIFYVMILFYLGGLMILFLYLISLLNMKKINFLNSWKYSWIFILSSLSLTLSKKMEYFYNLSEFYFLNNLLMILGILLLLALFLVLKMIDFFSGSMKSFIKSNEI